MTENRRIKKRKQRSDSVGEAIKVAQASFQDVLLPSHIQLAPEHMPFWNSIISEYPKSEWSNHQLEMAGFLAREMYNLENNQCLMRREGSVFDVKNEKGEVVNRKVNPRSKLMDMHFKTVLSLRRSLALHARGKSGESRDILRRRQGAAELEKFLDEIDDEDGLLARPPKLMQ